VTSVAARTRAFAALDAGLPGRMCKALVLFAPQGAIVLLFYAVLGFSTPPDELPYGLQLDPRHGVLHLVTGIVAGLIGFRAARLARPFLQVFGVSYLVLALLGTFTTVHLGMDLHVPENGLHWTLGALGTFVGFHPRTVERIPDAARQSGP
jgi:hypothetical protein